VNPLATSVFDLPDHLAPKADTALIAGGERHFAAIAESLERSIAELSDRLEFDLVVLVDPAALGQGIEAAVDRYVAMTRATQQLVILTSS